jgi:protein-tyrosine phosphatase
MEVVMIDIHSHLLPEIDDGSRSFDMSLDMLAMAADSGTHVIVSTSHCNIPGYYDNYVSDQLLDLWNQLNALKQEAGIPIHLLRGMEVYATEELPDLLKSGRVWTLNGTKYFLMEFGFDEDPAFCAHILPACVALGYHPIIAHPERYYFVQDDPRIAYGWCVSGYGLQLNKDSILGRFGHREKACAEALLRHNLAACVASDAHRSKVRTTSLAGVRDVLMSLVGSEYTELLLERNPDRILQGKQMLGYAPMPFEM